MKNTILNFILLAVTFTGMVSCNSLTVYDEYRSIPDMTWNKDSLLVFIVDIENTTNNNDIFVQLRHDVKYSYSNIWLFIEIEEPGGKSVRDTLEIALADPSGKWLGDGRGALRTVDKEIRRQIFFPEPGTYKFSLQQGMRDEWLKGVHDAGIRIEKISESE